MSHTAEASGFRYAPGLDGIRALAVFAVVCYHLGTTSGADILPGGFLGVDIFFVLSGYLITSLLVVEARKNGRISIKAFYLRRARRLLPALFALLLVVGAIGAYWLPQQAARLRGDLVAALAYVTNWWLVAENSSYFNTAGDRPALLTHLWSLAVEEQYYLIWPLILIGFFAIRARRGLMLTLVLAGVAASTVAAALMYDPYIDPSRVYYGTDTRAVAPLLGGALAIAVQPWRHRQRLPARERHLLDTVGILALLGLTVVAATLRDSDDFLYRGGFLVIAVLAAAVVGVGGHPGTALGEMLSLQPLRWLGERSYAIYLWHWPVCVLTRPGEDIPITGLANIALRVALTLLLAELSYHLVETPIRKHGFLAPLRASARPAPGSRVAAGRAVRGGPRRRPIFRTAFLAVTLVAGGSAVGLQLSAAASTPVTGGPIDAAPDVELGPLGSATPTPSASAIPPPLLPRGSKVAFFGDSQGRTLLLNTPSNITQYINLGKKYDRSTGRQWEYDATINGCGVLLGVVVSQDGKWNLAANCPNWRSEWASSARRIKPDIAVIMVGAWDLFDLIVNGQTLTFGSPDWDANFVAAARSGVDALVADAGEVAISLLPCYHPLKKSAGLWRERGDQTRTRHVNQLLTDLVATYPEGVRVIEPPVQFCTDPAIANNTSYRWDGIHYAKQGAALYFSAILPQLLLP